MVSTSRRQRRAAAVAAILAAVCVFATAPVHAADTLRATLDRDVVHEGDSVRLTLSRSADGDAATLDLAPLATDFEVLGTQQSQSISMVDGRVTAQRQLEVLLSPRRSGRLTVPALRAGDASSAPLDLTVLDAATGGSPSGGDAAAPADPRDASTASGDAPDLFVEATADRTQPFVQGEVRYTVRVYDGVGIREGALTEPEAEGVRVEPRGDTRNYEKVVRGRRYMVHEREYALYPQQSGELTVPPVVLQARVADPRPAAARSPFDDAFGDSLADEMFAEMFARMRGGSPFGSSILDRVVSPGREVRVRSNPVQLSVQGRPADAPGGWFLPARSVELAQLWQPANPTFRVGEAVRRTITLRAEGAAAAQLPKLEIPGTDGLRQYPGEAQPGAEERRDGGASEAVQTVELVPTRAGTFTLPAIEVAWWDVEAKTARTATLPAQTIEVLPAPGTAAQQASAAPAAKPAAPAAGEPLAARRAIPSTNAAADGAAPERVSALNAPLGALLERPEVLAGGAVVILLLVTTTWSLARRTRASHATASPDASRTAPHVTPRALVDALHQACTANDARAARDALVAWGRVQWPHAAPASSSEIARRIGHPGLLRAVKELDDALYAPRATSFDGAALWREFRAARKDADRSSAAPPELLPALYPSSRVA